MKFC
ncbi:Protein of unknown function [Bacillus wiedmannii]